MCGIVGITGRMTVAPELVVALFSMQHRGQDAAGVVTLDNGTLRAVKGLGQVDAALPADQIATLAGTTGIGHVRYPTHGGAGLDDTHPYITRLGGIALAHNGNLTNTAALSDQLREVGLRPLSRNDGEVLVLLLAHELNKLDGARSNEAVINAARAVMQRAEGAYSVVATLRVGDTDTIVCFRDAHGIRPAVYGERGGDWVVASESVALDALGVTRTGDVPAGHILLLAQGKPAILVEGQPPSERRCVFENVYFARPDSVIGGQRVNATRWAMGDVLGKHWAARGHRADVIVPVPDTSRPAAQAMSERLGIPHREGFIKNRYSGRTFIMPDAQTREAALRLKLNPIREVFEGKRVLLVDDSVVRGSTMRRIAALVRTLGPTEVHLAVFSPPVRHPCFYGIDIPTTDELIASQHGEIDLERTLSVHFGVDSVTYLPIEGLAEAVGTHLCAACFDGDYPVTVNETERHAMQRQRRPIKGAGAS